MARPEYKPTKARKRKVKDMAGLGIPQEDIARAMGIAEKTLRKHFRDELDNAKTELVLKIGGKIVRNAMNGCVASAIFYMKCQGGWRETQTIDLKTNSGVLVVPPQQSDEDWAAQAKADNAANPEPPKISK